MERNEVDDLFMGQGFERLVLASGGVPRDFLSLLWSSRVRYGAETELPKEHAPKASWSAFCRPAANNSALSRLSFKS
jgi:hypothetical protein